MEQTAEIEIKLVQTKGREIIISFNKKSNLLLK
jgi:hypothetical protein